MVHSEDETLARLLISTWELYTGRTLRNAPVDELTEQELIDFWDDPPAPARCGVAEDHSHGRPGEDTAARARGVPSELRPPSTIPAAARRPGGCHTRTTKGEA